MAGDKGKRKVRVRLKDMGRQIERRGGRRVQRESFLTADRADLQSPVPFAAGRCLKPISTCIWICNVPAKRLHHLIRKAKLRSPAQRRTGGRHRRAMIRRMTVSSLSSVRPPPASAGREQVAQGDRRPSHPFSAVCDGTRARRSRARRRTGEQTRGVRREGQRRSSRKAGRRSVSRRTPCLQTSRAYCIHTCHVAADPLVWRKSPALQLWTPTSARTTSSDRAVCSARG